MEVGQYTLTASFTGTGDDCVFSFDPVTVSVIEEQTVNTTIHGRGGLLMSDKPFDVEATSSSYRGWKMSDIARGGENRKAGR